jgi:2-polyprenyl-3-methyl-5-hydroxy-6-metoxy-1,4-benzoquinol methylase
VPDGRISNKIWSKNPDFLDSMNEDIFDEGYYARYYENRLTRVADPVHFVRLGRFVGAYCGLLGIRVRSILDLGCGIGTLKKPLLKRFPKAAYTGVDVSPYACAKFGWERASASDYSPGHRFDLVVCHDVLQYLSDKEAGATIKNFDALCRSVLYFSVLTKEDWDQNCDKSLTDSDVNLRTTNWYRRRLQRHFRNLGGGVYTSRSLDVVLYSLEHLD